MGGLELRLFGVFQARLDGRPLVNFRSAKVQGLLIHLALTRPRAHQRDVLAGLLWPDEPDAVAKKNLRQALYRLGKLLDDRAAADPPYLLVSRTTVQLNPDKKVYVDVEDFRAHLAAGEPEAALGLYHGDLLPGFESSSEPFNDRLRSEREDLQRSLLAALAERAEERLFRGEHDSAAELARRQMEIEPWREEAHRQLMRALVLSGDRSGAMAQFEACRRILATELGIEPSPATADLARRIRDNDLARPIPRRADPTPVAQPASWFVARNDELTTLVTAYERSGRGTFELVALAGSGGVGKTTLAERFLQWAAMEGADVLSGSAFATRSGLPYQPLTDLLRRRIERENAPDDLVSDEWLSQLSRLLPELRDRYPDLAAPAQDEGSARQHLFEAITRVGVALAQRGPVIVFVDDIHWADVASLDAIAYAAQRWAELEVPLLLLFTVRPETLAVSASLAAWVDQLSRTMTPTRIDLPTLSASETQLLAEAMLGDRSSVDPVEVGSGGTDRSGSTGRLGEWLYARTGGHPLLVTETVKALVAADTTGAQNAETGSSPMVLPVDEETVKVHVIPALRGVVEGWLTRISPAARSALTASSVLREDTSLDRLQTLTGLAELTVAGAIDELLRAQLLCKAEGAAGDQRYRFTHELVGDVVAEFAGPTGLQLLHRRSLDVLRADGASAARLIGHALRAGAPTEAFELSLTAAQDAMGDLAAGVAIEHFSTASQIAEDRGWPPSIPSAREAVLWGLGRAYELTEQWEEAERVHEDALTYARRAGLPAVERQALVRLARLSQHASDHERRERAMELLENARALAADAGDRRGMAEVDLELASIAYHGGDLTASRQHIERALAHGHDVLDRRLAARHLTLLCLTHISHRRWPEAAAAGWEAVDLYADDQILAHDARRSVAYCELQSGRPTKALAILEDAVAFTRKIDNFWGETECLWKLAHTHLELGHYGLALEYAQHGLTQSRDLGVPAMHELSLAVLGTVQRTLFDLGGARTTFGEDLGALRREMGTAAVTFDWSATELCTITALANDWERAAEFAALRPDARGDPSILTSGLSAWDAVEALLRSGDETGARAEVAHLAAAAAGNDRYKLVLRRSQAVLAAWDGDTGGAAAHLHDALRLAQTLGLPGEEWPILAAHAVALDARGERTAAQGMVETAAAIVYALAATIDDDQVRGCFVDADAVQAVLTRV